MTSIDTSQSSDRSRPRGILISMVLAGVIGSIANAIVAVAGLAAGADPGTQGLTPPAYISFTVIGVLVGAIGWAIISRARSAARILAILVPLVLLLSLIPDIALAVGATSGAVVTAAVTLGVMHIVTAAVAVPIYRRFLPLADGR